MPDFIFWNEVVIPLAGMAFGLVIIVTVIRTVARQMDRRHEARMAGSGPPPDAMRADLQQLRSQVESLEERLDFTERLLTQERSRRPLEPGN